MDVYVKISIKTPIPAYGIVQIIICCAWVGFHLAINCLAKYDFCCFNIDTLSTACSMSSGTKIQSKQNKVFSPHSNHNKAIHDNI